MSQYVTVAAAMTIAPPRLRAYLSAPVAPASTWLDWADLRADQDRAELTDAVAECDGWLDGDYASLLREADELALGYDEDTGSLTVDFDARVDFRLPSLIWACTVVRGMATFMADDDTGLIAVTVDWAGDEVLMSLSPGQSSFLDRSRDSDVLARAKDMAFDVRCAATGTDIDQILRA